MPFETASVTAHDLGPTTIFVTRKPTIASATCFCSRQSTLNVFAPAAGAASAETARTSASAAGRLTA